VTDLPALETFVAIARLGSVMRAADRLGRTQPSLSARLGALEEAWGVRLFRRHARGMSLTPEGTRLLPVAEAALRGIVELDRAAGVPISGRDELRVGAGDALGRELIPRTMTRLLREEPSLSVRLLEGSASRLLDALRNAEIDIALVAGAAAAGTERGGLAVERLLESAVVLLAPGSERRAGAATLEGLRDRRLVALQRGSAFRRHIEEAFEARGLPFRPAVEVGNLSLVRRFVAAGLGVAPVPAVAFGGVGPGSGVSRRALRGVAPLPYAVARRPGVPLTSSAARFLDLLRVIAGRAAGTGRVAGPRPG